MASDETVPKMNGFDIEVANYIAGLQMPGGTGREASLALWRHFEGTCPSTQWTRDASQTNLSPSYDMIGAGTWYDASRAGGSHNGGASGPAAQETDWGRKWLPSMGGCCYIDSFHLEICSGEILGARDHVGKLHAMLEKIREARQRANVGLPAGQSVEVFANSSDGLSNSFGSHINVLVTRRCLENVLHRKVHQLSFLAAHQASAIIYAGQGKVGSENGHAWVDYQFSQRADFVEQLLAVQTMWKRPLVNARDEGLCGPPARGFGSDSGTAAESLARLHVISYDTTLCHIATFLKVGTLQLVLCMLEQEIIDPSLCLDDPVEAVAQWSHGDLRALARLASGGRCTAIELQEGMLEKATAFVSDGRASGLVPEAPLIIRQWARTLQLLRQNDIHSLARRCDWALKLVALDRAMTKHQKDWSSPEIKMLDHMYSSVASDEGLYWQYERAGFVERIVSSADIKRAGAEPHESTRAWLRAQLLRRADPEEIDDVDWDSIRFRPQRQGRRTVRTLYMNNPLRFTRA